MTVEKSVIEDWLHRCIRCSNCKYIFRDYTPSCPSGEKFRFETYYASGRIGIAQAIHRGEIEWDESLLKPLFACTTCGSCEVQCLAPHSEHIVEMIEEVRYHAVQALGALPEHKKFKDRILETHNPYGADHHNQQMKEIHDLPDSAELVYFIGCTSNYREIEIRDATISLLKKAGVEFTVVDEWCCGSPLLRTGQREPVMNLGTHNIQAFYDTGAKQVVTSCSGCYKTLKEDYAKIGMKHDVNIVHLTQLLEELLGSGKLKVKDAGSIGSITYHDPCHLGKHMGVYEVPREVISRLHVDLIEMSDSRENSWCCGAGGGAKAAYNDWSIETAEKRIQHARAVSVDTIVSACPFCKRNLKETSDEIEVLDISELADGLINS